MGPLLNIQDCPLQVWPFEKQGGKCLGRSPGPEKVCFSAALSPKTSQMPGPIRQAGLHDSEHRKPGGKQGSGGGALSVHPPIKATGPGGLRRICWETTEDEDQLSGFPSRQTG